MSQGRWRLGLRKIKLICVKDNFGQRFNSRFLLKTLTITSGKLMTDYKLKVRMS